MSLNSLPSQERLKSKKSITSLFNEGKSEKKFPLICKYIVRLDNDDPSISVAFSVPKRVFKKAVDRNLLKRRMREAYRLNIQSFREQLIANKVTLDIMWLYTGKEVMSVSDITKSLCTILNRLSAKLDLT